MTRTYEKPYAKNLGDIPNAQGYCLSGSTATIAIDQNCIAGITAIGSYCGFGGNPDPNPVLGCNAGAIPDFNGCGVGYQNTSSCSLGQGPR
jgi:hypothetical protein